MQVENTRRRILQVPYAPARQIDGDWYEQQAMIRSARSGEVQGSKIGRLGKDGEEGAAGGRNGLSNVRNGGDAQVVEAER